MFPIFLIADRVRGWSNYEFQPLFLKNKPEDTSWYAFDVEILSPTLVRFIGFDLDHYYGGVGKEKFRFEVSVDAEMTEKARWAAAQREAHVRRDAELKRIESLIIDDYTKEIFDANS